VRRKWIWFRNTREGRSPAREEFDALPPVARAQLSVRIDRYLAGETRYKDVDSLGDGILELRVRLGSNHYRVLFMLWGSHCVALTAFFKNQQKTPPADLRRAKTRAARWQTVFGQRPDR
jgi:phage-related protein